MKVFISWSGERSRDVATALGDWLPQVLHAIDPFVSTRDLAAGARWAIELAEKLEETAFGIVCVTRENQSEPWLNYEAGAIAKSIAASRVAPLAIDLSPAEIVHPLGQFQATRADREGVGEIIKSMNEACASPISEKYLSKAIEMWWPQLEKRLEEIEMKSYKVESKASPSPRGERAILEEVLNTVRGLARQPHPEVDRRNPQRDLSEDIQEIMRTSGVLGWGASYGPGAVKLRPNEPLGRQTLEELSLLGKIRNVDIRVESHDEPELP